MNLLASVYENLALSLVARARKNDLHKMKSFVAFIFIWCFTLSLCSVGRLLAESDLIKRKEKCGEVSSWNCN